MIVTFRNWLGHLKPLETTIIWYLTEGTLQFRNILNQNCSHDSETVILNSQLFRIQSFSEFAPWVATNWQNRKAPHLKLSAKKRAKSPQTPANENRTEFPESVFSVRSVEYPLERTELHHCWDSVQSCIVAGPSNEKKKKKTCFQLFPQEPS